MTAAIKKMLAEKAGAQQEREAGRGWEALMDETFAMVDSAAPFMDEGCDPDRWPPSALLKIAYCAAATGPTVNKAKIRAAHQFILDMLERSRRMYIAGYIPDPFATEPRLRSEAVSAI